MRLAVTLGILATRHTVDEVYHSRADFNKIYLEARSKKSG
jgi:hypothetical protein